MRNRFLWMYKLLRLGWIAVNNVKPATWGRNPHLQRLHYHIDGLAKLSEEDAKTLMAQAYKHYMALAEAEKAVKLAGAAR